MARFLFTPSGFHLPRTQSTRILHDVQKAESPSRAAPAPSERRPKGGLPHLFRKFVWMTLLCSALPLLLVGWGINIYYTDFGRERMLADFETEVEYHRKLIEGFLSEHSSKLQLVAGPIRWIS